MLDDGGAAVEGLRRAYICTVGERRCQYRYTDEGEGMRVRDFGLTGCGLLCSCARDAAVEDGNAVLM